MKFYVKKLLIFTLLSFSGVSHAAVEVQPYTMNLTMYIKNLITVSCEKGMSGDSPDKLIDIATYGISKDTAFYKVIHNFVILGGAIGEKLKEGSFKSKDKSDVQFDNCDMAADYIVTKSELRSMITSNLLQ